MQKTTKASMKKTYSNMQKDKEEIRNNITKFAESLRNHPDVIEHFLWEAYYGEYLGFDSDGNAYCRHSGDEFIPHTINL